MKNRLVFLFTRFVLVFSLLLASPAGAVGKKQATPAADVGRVWVVRSDGAQSCGIKEGLSPEQMGDELRKAGIQVFEMRKGTDGKMHAQMCGAPTGGLNGFEILSADLPKALLIGYKEAPKGFSP